jgi:hypothetical protein
MTSSKACNAYLRALLANGALLREKAPVLALVHAFLAATKRAWQEVCARSANAPKNSVALAFLPALRVALAALPAPKLLKMERGRGRRSHSLEDFF